MSTLLGTSGFTTVTTAVVAGISPSMAASAALLGRLTVYSTCKPAGTIIFTVTGTLKVTAITFTRERCEWDSGSESVKATKVLTRRQAGKQCLGSSLKRCQKLSSKQVTRDQLDFLKRFYHKTVEKKPEICRKTALLLRKCSCQRV